MKCLRTPIVLLPAVIKCPGTPIVLFCSHLGPFDGRSIKHSSESDFANFSALDDLILCIDKYRKR